MAIAALLVILALIVGGVALFVTALKWLLIIAAVLLIVGLVMGFARRTTPA